MLLILFLGTVLNVYTNDVVVKRADTTITPTIGMELKDIDTVIVKDSSKAEILYSDSTVLYLDENTTINTSGTKKRSIFLSFGRIWAKVKKLVKGESLEVVTPVSVSGISGTEFEQSFIADKVECKMMGGSLSFEDTKTGKESMLGEGQMASMEKGKPFKIGKFNREKVKHWYKWKKGDADFVLRKLKKAYDDGEHGKVALLSSQVMAVAGVLGVVGEYEAKMDKLHSDAMRIKEPSILKGLFASTEAGFLQAISSEDKGANTFILLKWPQMEGVKAFNLYRKEIPSTLTPTTPINSKPITLMKDCNEIKKVIHSKTEEWQAIVNILNRPSPTGTKTKVKGSTSKESSLITRKAPEIERFAVPVSMAKLGPCGISTISDTSQAYRDLQALAGRYWKVAVVMGQAYVDNDVVPGKKYMYSIMPAAQKGGGTELIKPIDTATVIAGKVLLLPPPSGVITLAGDNKIMVRWNEMGAASGYDVYRKVLMSGFVKVNGADIMEKCILDLEGDTIPEMLCFVDFMRWDEAGYPAKHEVVAPDSIYGPLNGLTYNYKVRAFDALGRPGMFSSSVPALPQDKTPPAVPYGIQVDAYADGLQSKWFQVTHDELGHVEIPGIDGYKVYRFNSADSLLDSIVVSTMVPDTFGTFPYYKDTDPALFSAYGEQTYWYRVRSIDKAGNVSGLSASAGNNLPDTTPPKRPQDLKAVSHADRIALSWKKPNPVPSDLAGYNIYRGVCGADSVCKGYVQSESHYVKEPRCTLWVWEVYPMHLVGNKDHPDSLTFNDFTVPPSSPICYRYTIKAYDRSQNLSDTSRTVCQKLREETPPAPPILAGLKARDRAVKVEWISSPVQDLFGFMVDRAEEEAGPYLRISDTLIFDEEVDCEDIPATNNWAADSVFSFIDTTVEEKKVYWYRVRAADYGGNKGNPSVPIETYTYNLGPPPTPHHLKVNQPPGQCALLVQWRPLYDKEYSGFVVFRSSDPAVGYRQISPIIRGNKFLDNKVRGKKDYYYKVQYFAKNGNRSLVSNAKSGKATP